MFNSSAFDSYNELIEAIKAKDVKKTLKLLDSTTVSKDSDGDYRAFKYVINWFFAEHWNCIELFDNQIRKQKLKAIEQHQ